MNDVDVSSKMTREIFEEKSKHILERVKLPLQKVCPCLFYKTGKTLAGVFHDLDPGCDRSISIRKHKRTIVCKLSKVKELSFPRKGLEHLH